MNPNQVSLSLAEVFQASCTGNLRYVISVRDGRKDRNGAEQEDGLQIHVEGAIGEMAIAKWKGINWEAHLDHFSGPDVGRVQVRMTRRDGGRLIIREHDREEDTFYLVTGEYRLLTIRGWIVGKEGKLKKWIDAPNGRPPAWFVPQSVLHAPSVFV